MGEELPVRSFTFCAKASMVISSVLPTLTTSPMERSKSMRRMRLSTVFTHVAKAARLLSAAVDADGGVVQGGLDELGSTIP